MSTLKEEQERVVDRLVGMALQYGSEPLVERMTPDDFPESQRHLAEAIWSLDCKGHTITETGICDFFVANKTKRPKIERLQHLRENAASPDRIDELVADLRKLCGAEVLLKAAGSVIEKCAWAAESYDLDEMRGTLLAALDDSVTGSVSRVSSWNEAGEDSLAGYMLRRQGIKPPVIPHGIASLREHVPGWENGRLYVVAGRTGGGKSLLLGEIMRHATRGHLDHLGRKARAVLVSLEMSPVQVRERGAAAETGIPLNWTLEPHLNLTPEQDKLWMDALKTADEECGILIAGCNGDDRADVSSIDAIESLVRLYQRRKMCDILCVDYAALVKASGKDVRERVSNVVVQLKKLALSLQIPVLLASQLNRDGHRDNNEPYLAQLSESAVIEHTADVVMLMHRPFAGPDGRPPSYPYAEGIEDAQIVVAKHRYGKCGLVDIGVDLPTFRVGSDAQELQLSRQQKARTAMGPQLDATPEILGGAA